MKLISQREIILLSIDLVLLVVALPFLAGLRVELDQLRDQQTATGAIDTTKVEPAAATPATTAPAKNTLTRRTIARPQVLVTKTFPAVDAPEDPFIAEARKRATEDPEAAMAWLQSQSMTKERLRGMLEIVAIWAADDSQGALLWLESNAQGVARIESLYNGMELWGQQDPKAAAEWIDGMANDGSKVTAAKALAANWVNKNPDEAANWIDSLPSGSVRSNASDALIEAWADKDPEAATIWAVGEAETSGNMKLLNKSIELYTLTNPRDAEEFLRGMNRAYDATPLIDTYVASLAKNDPSEALRWLDELESDDAFYSSNHANTVLKTWSETDSVAASAWLSEQAPGPQRDAAITGFTSTMLKFEPEAAMEWSNSISDANTRSSWLLKSVRNWAKTQPHEALEWVKNAELDSDLRNSLASEVGVD